jgi:hypothetical protein
MRIKLADLTELQFLNGTLTLIFMVISLILGLKILFKYFTYHKEEFITVGLTWIFLSSAWWGTSLSFLFIILFEYAFDPLLYIYIGNVFIPLAVVCWAYSVSSMVYPYLKKKILLIYLIICISYEVFLIIFIFINPDLISIYVGLFYLKPRGIGLLFIVFAIITVFIFGILFSIKSLRSDNPKIQWKGRFMLTAFISFIIASVINAIIPLTAITLIVVRVILISSAIEYYLGFMLPERLAALLIKKSE